MQSDKGNRNCLCEWGQEKLKIYFLSKVITIIASENI